jgi:hypothetical protein
MMGRSDQGSHWVAFYFRRSKKLGPLRVTASKRGLSVSGGAGGARASKSSTGRRTTSVRLPGTGAFWRRSKG